jgi:hypothetical protein
MLITHLKVNSCADEILQYFILSPSFKLNQENKGKKVAFSDRDFCLGRSQHFKEIIFTMLFPVTPFIV